ncbi:MAG: UDPGP type 1 family protein [Planctomycetota bacterium]|nr:UDPGP type 1 family protein [Planctomycetota bacterium]
MREASQDWMKRVHDYGHGHVLRFWSELSSDDQKRLASQIQSIDFQELATLFSGTEKSVDWSDLSRRAEPPNAIRLHDNSPNFSKAEALECGENAIRQGKIGMILVAGGQGTRLGFDQPKGMFRIGPVSNRSLFAMHADSLRGAMRKYGTSIPFYVMTSPATDLATREYFRDHHHLGLKPEELVVFCQGTMPAVDATTGKILMESKSQMALSPDGHGGIVASLDKQGILKAAAERGIEHFFYAQVDNPLVRACDPLLIGYHLLAKSQMTTQVVKKRFGKEKVGNVVSIDGRAHIIEYSDLPDDVAARTDPDGELSLWAGNIAVHVLDLDFVANASRNAGGLPFHRAIKQVPYLREDGVLEKPVTPNAIKYERFVFDLLPLAERTMVVEGDARDVFAPVKNAEGAPTDTPTATRQALSMQHKRWLEQAGVAVNPSVKVEINPHWALDVDEVRMKIQKASHILVDTYFA